MTTIKQLSLTNKRVFIRCDFNVPIHNKRILSDLRIRNSLETITYVLSKHPKQVILASHLGRPKGFDASLSLKIVARRLEKLLGKKIYFHENILDPIPESRPLVLLENLRFFDGETRDCKRLAKKLKQHADVYIDDAFGTAHRKQTSVHALPLLFPPSKKAPGFLMMNEVKEVSFHHKKPIVFVFGAAKLSDKIPLLKSVIEHVDKVLLGGGVVFTFLKALDVPVGKSLVEDSMLSQAKSLIKKYPSKFVFPTDFIIAPPSALKKPCPERKRFTKRVDFDAIPSSQAAFDLGPKSSKLFSAIIKRAKTVIWNGPLGLFEYAPFNRATRDLAKSIASQKDLHSIVCGGDTAAALKKTKYKSDMSFISTGGGASLQLLSGKALPAITALEKDVKK